MNNLAGVLKQIGQKPVCRSSSFRVEDVRHGTERDEAVRQRTPSIVVVEDEPDISELLTSLFSAEGFATLAATDARSGLQLARSSHPDAITLDLGLPDRDGRQLLHDLKSDARTRDIPVIVVSAYSGGLGAEDRRLVAAVVDKPFDLGELLRVTRNTLQPD